MTNHPIRTFWRKINSIARLPLSITNMRILILGFQAWNKWTHMLLCCFMSALWLSFSAAVLDGASLFLFRKRAITKWTHVGTSLNWTRMHCYSKRWSNECMKKWFRSLVKNTNIERWQWLECNRRVPVGTAAVCAATTTGRLSQWVRSTLVSHLITISQINLSLRQ